MIRLYLHVAESQKDIQELRKQLQNAEKKNLGFTSELETNKQTIAKLEDDEEQARKAQEVKERRQEKAQKELKQLLKQVEAEKEAEELVQSELLEHEEELQNRLQQLALSESNSCKRFQRTQSLNEQALQLHRELQEIAAEHEELLKRLNPVTQLRTRLRGEWDTAVELATLERRQVQQATTEDQALRDYAANEEMRAALLHHEGLEMEQTAASLWRGINKVHGEDSRNRQLNERLYVAQQDQQDLWNRLTFVEGCNYKLQSELSASQRQTQALEEVLKSNRSDLEVLQEKVEQTNRRSKELTGQRQTLEQCSSQLKDQLQQAEAESKRRVEEMRLKRQREQQEAAELHKAFEELSSKGKSTEQQLNTARSKAEELRAKLKEATAKRDAAAALEAERKAELEVERNKIRCTIS